MNLTFNDIKNIHKKIRHNVKWTETTYTSSISEKLGIDTFLVLYDQNHTHNVHQHLDPHFSRIAHTPDIAHGIHEYQEVYV